MHPTEFDVVSAMHNLKINNTRRILAGLNFLGLDRIYQQLDSEIGMVLTFHHVRPDPVTRFSPNAHLTIHPEFLDSVLGLLKRRDFEFVTLDEVRKRILKGEAQKRFAAVTFDDGYRDTLVHAAPVLRKHNVPYTVYVAPGFVEKIADVWWEGIEELVRQQERILVPTAAGNMELDCSTLAKKYEAFRYLLQHLTVDTAETDQRRAVRELCWLYKIDLDAILEREIMTWDELRILQNDPLCTIGAHTLHHRALARLDEKSALAEVVQGASVLEAELGQRPGHLAFPYGYKSAAGAREFEMVRKAKYKTAVTTRPGMIFPQHKDHLTALPRISVNGLFQRMRYFAPLTTGLPTRISSGFKKLDIA